MHQVELDRLLWTCVKQLGTDVLLIKGQPPMMRGRNGFQQFLVPPLESVDVLHLLRSVAPGSMHDDLARAGQAEFEFWHLNRYPFRAYVFRLGAEDVVFLSRLFPEERRESQGSGGDEPPQVDIASTPA